MSTAATPDDRPAGQIAWSAGALVLLLIGAAGWLAGFADYIGDPVLAPAMALSFGLLGPWVARRGVRIIGFRMTLVGLAAGVSWAAQTWSRFTAAAWLSQWSWLLPVLLVPLVLVRFPDGRLNRRWRLLEPALVALTITPVALLAVAALGAPHNLLTGGAPRPGWTAPLVMAAIAGSGLWLVPCGLTGVLLIGRGRRTQGQERAQIICLGLGLVGLLVGIGLLIAGAPAVTEAFAAVSLPAAVAAAVLRFALYDLDLVVNRLLVWFGLTAVVAAGFAALVTLLSLVFPGNHVSAPELLALLILALTIEPLRGRLQLAVDRLLFGRRSAPAEAFAVVSRDLGRATTAGSGEVLCRAIAATLQLPWVGVRDIRGELTAAWGRRIDDVLSFPLRLDERTVGDLLVCPRRLNQRLTPAERAIIDGMAAQVAVAVEAMSLAENLRQARERIVASREQERVRLRNDLHDGLGPALVGLRIQAAAYARGSAEPAISTAFHQIAEDAAGCVAEVSRVIEGLRPAALDNGLQAAIEVEARRLAGDDVTINVVVPQPLPAIPEAAELAAFRIACEAMSNAVRHANADTISVQLTIEEHGGRELLLRVVDDGRGLGPPRDGGVGLQSIRQRADEAGGFVSIAPGPLSGTAVTAELPLAGS